MGYLDHIEKKVVEPLELQSLYFLAKTGPGAMVGPERR